jgi:hypothetical protein
MRSFKRKAKQPTEARLGLKHRIRLLRLRLGLYSKRARPADLELVKLMGNAAVRLAGKPGEAIFERIRKDIREGNIPWIKKGSRTAAITFIQSKLAGIELTEKNAKFTLKMLSESDRASLEKLIENY